MEPFFRQCTEGLVGFFMATQATFNSLSAGKFSKSNPLRNFYNSQAPSFGFHTDLPFGF